MLSCTRFYLEHAQELLSSTNTCMLIQRHWRKERDTHGIRYVCDGCGCSWDAQRPNPGETHPAKSSGTHGGTHPQSLTYVTKFQALSIRAIISNCAHFYLYTFLIVRRIRNEAGLVGRGCVANWAQGEEVLPPKTMGQMGPIGPTKPS